MADTTITPNMNLPVPVPSTAPGPDWATTVVADMYAIDSHNHTSGQGVAITPAALNINADLSLAGNNATTVRSINFTSQDTPISLPTDLGCVYVSGEDLYYNDESGNQVRITQGGSVAGSTGTITGLPSGTASASFAAGTFTFQSATSTPATMAVGPVVIGRAASGTKTVTLAPNGSQAADYGLTFPSALPGSTSMMSLDTSGNIASVATTGSGSVVLATAPAFSGVPTGTVTGAAFSPTVTWTLTSGVGLTITNNTSAWYYQRIGNVVFVSGKANFTSSAFVSNSSYRATATIPIATAALTNSGFYTQFITTVSTAVLTDVSNTSVQTGAHSFTGNFSASIVFAYSYVIS